MNHFLFDYIFASKKSHIALKWIFCSGVFIVNFEHISHLVLVFLLLTLGMWLPVGKWLDNEKILKINLPHFPLIASI